jgi:hypothetical protein
MHNMLKVHLSAIILTMCFKKNNQCHTKECADQDYYILAQVRQPQEMLVKN